MIPTRFTATTRRATAATLAVGLIALAAACASLSASPVLAAEASPAPSLGAVDPAQARAFEAAWQQFDQALASGASASIEAAAQQFSQLASAHAADPVLRAYAGSATALKARTTLLPWRKMSLAEDGLAQLDQALSRLTPAHDAPLHRGVPAVLEVRFTAASTFLALPAMFNRGTRGETLLAEVVKSPLLAQAPLGFQGSVWLKAGQQAASAGRKDEARQWFDKVVASQAPQAAAAQAGRQAL